MRHQLSGTGIEATGSFRGLPPALTVFGAERSETLPILGAGFDFAVSEAAGLFVDYRGEFGNGTEGQNVNVGLSFRF